MNEDRVAEKDSANPLSFLFYILFNVTWYIALGTLSTLALSKFFSIDVGKETIVAMAILLFVAKGTFSSSNVSVVRKDDK